MESALFATGASPRRGIQRCTIRGREPNPPLLLRSARHRELERLLHGADPMENESLRETAEKRARWLGAFSVGLGLVQLTAPSRLARALGLRDSARTRAVLAGLGMREVANGVGLLAKPSAPSFAWARVVGDAMDLALLGEVLRKGGSSPRALAAGAAVLGVAAVDVFSAARLSRSGGIQKLVQPIHVLRSITINRPPETVYHFWRDLANLPRFMAHLESVEVDNGKSTWRAKAPAGTHIEWEAEITLDRANEAIAWRSLEGALVPNRGVVRFTPAPGDRGTEVMVELKYDPPGGAIAAAMAKLFGEEPSQQIAGDLRRLKQMLETGDVVHSDASIHRGMHAARPADTQEKITVLGHEEQR